MSQAGHNKLLALAAAAVVVAWFFWPRRAVASSHTEFHTTETHDFVPEELSYGPVPGDNPKLGCVLSLPKRADAMIYFDAVFSKMPSALPSAGRAVFASFCLTQQAGGGNGAPVYWRNWLGMGKGGYPSWYTGDKGPSTGLKYAAYREYHDMWLAFAKRVPDAQGFLRTRESFRLQDVDILGKMLEEAHWNDARSPGGWTIFRGIMKAKAALYAKVVGVKLVQGSLGDALQQTIDELGDVEMDDGEFAWDAGRILAAVEYDAQGRPRYAGDNEWEELVAEYVMLVDDELKFSGGCE